MATRAVDAQAIDNLDDLTTVPKALLKERIAALSDERLREIEGAIRFALDLP